jgi:hypothetical protein
MQARLIFVIGLSLGSAATVAGQATAPPAALSSELQAHVRNGRFDVVTSLRGLPLGVRGALQTLIGSPTLDIAEPGAAFQASGETSNAGLPMRRLVAAGCSYEDCLVYYERGGSAGRTWRVALFHWTPTATTFEWGGTAPGGLTIDGVRSAVLSGTIKGSAGPW